jgi:putative FmdB family regulatory protein
MPIYSYECPEHGVFDLLRTIQHADDTHAKCEVCDARSQRCIELCAVQPDSLWHFGQRVDGREINSRAALERHDKENHLVTIVGQNDRDAIKKMTEEGKRDKAAKASTERRKAFEQVAAGSGLVNSFGELRPEAARRIA